MKKYSNIEITGSLLITGSLVVGGVAEMTASNAVSSSFATTAVSAFLSDTTSQIDDRGSLNYLDIGTVRIQWGIDTSGLSSPVITFPVAFANNTYSLTATCEDAFTTNAVRIAATDDKTTTSFRMRKANSTALTTSTKNTSWIAIGLRP